jgi:hypothetical protein
MNKDDAKRRDQLVKVVRAEVSFDIDTPRGILIQLGVPSAHWKGVCKPAPCPALYRL